jgi:hypothetical protein
MEPISPITASGISSFQIICHIPPDQSKKKKVNVKYLHYEGLSLAFVESD